ncbi:penicillin-binding protein activator [Sphingomonas sp. 1P06PA]|uniref:penicillin-binding protein activator n=1 Tax=Sphingomonas sp. 1P06PA TaxID=554121 RepID=UPI0039A60319
MTEAVGRRNPVVTGLRALWLAATIALAGCTVVPKRPAPPPPPPPAEVPDEPTPGTLPQDQQRHRIALLVPMSGPNAAVGRSIANAANLAILDTGGARVRITTYDTATGASAAAARALADGNRLFLGPLLAEDVRAVSAQARAANVPVVAFSNDSSVAGSGTWLMGFSPAQSIDRVVGYARQRGMTRFAALIPSGLYGRNASSALIRAAEEAGGQVVSMQSYDRSPKSLTAAIARIPRTQPFDAILIADSGRIAIQAAPLVRKSGSPQARLLGTELWETEPGLAANPALAGAWFASVPDARYRQLATKYRARFGTAPYRLASLGYDAVLLTVRIAKDWRFGAPFPARELSESGGFAGVDGAFRFGRDGIAERTLEVNEVRGGGFTVVSPAPAGFGK